MNNTTVTYYAEGKTENGERIKGILTILGTDYGDIKKGFYLSNGANCPFAFSVIPDSVVILGDSIANLFG